MPLEHRRARAGGFAKSPRCGRLWANAGALYEVADRRLRGARPGPIIAVRLPDEQTAFGVAPLLLEHGVYVNLAPAGYAEWRLPAPLQRFGGAYAGRDRRSLPPVRPRSSRAQWRRLRGGLAAHG